MPESKKLLRPEIQEARRRSESDQLTPAERVQLRERIDATLASGGSRVAGPRPWALVGGAVGAAGIAALLVMLPRADVRIVAGGSCVAMDGVTIRVAGSCPEAATLDIGRERLVLQSGTSVERTEDGIRVERGEVELQVARRAPGEAPYRVQVSGGAITVLGTRFVVEQREHFGRVELFEGRIAFVAPGGEQRELHPGEALEWPLRAPVPSEPIAPEPESAAPVATHSVYTKPPATPSQPPAPDARTVMEELSRLRGQRRYADAVDYLRTTLERPGLEGDQAERLSFELGVLLVDRLDDSGAACAHWKAHVERFTPLRVHAGRVERYRAACP